MKLPAVSGPPAPDIAQVIAQAASRCATASSMTAEIAASGTVTGRRLRARLLIGLEAPGSARLEAFALGQQIFILVARGGDATLLLTRENRILQRGRPDEILGVVAGIPLDPAELRTALLGCPEPQALQELTAGPIGPSARQAGDEWRVVSADRAEFYFRRESPAGPWRMAAAQHATPTGTRWRAEYRDFRNDLPSSVRFVSIDGNRFDLRLTLTDVELNTKLPDAAFEVKIPPGAEPITIEELRQSGPIPTE